MRAVARGTGLEGVALAPLYGCTFSVARRDFSSSISVDCVRECRSANTRSNARAYSCG